MTDEIKSMALKIAEVFEEELCDIRGIDDQWGCIDDEERQQIKSRWVKAIIKELSLTCECHLRPTYRDGLCRLCFEREEARRSRQQIRKPEPAANTKRRKGMHTSNA